MPNPLSMDLRTSIETEIKDWIYSISDIAKKFEVSYATVYRLNDLFEKQGHVREK